MLLLCFLWSLGSLRSDLLPNLTANLLPSLERGSIPFLLLAVVSASFAVAREVEWPRGRQIWDSVLIGLGLFVVPASLVYLSKQWVPELTRVALFSLAPVFAVVFVPYIGGTEGPKGGLAAALAAVSGTLCVFPVETPGSIASGCAFCGVIVAAACAAAATCKAVLVASTLRG